MYEEISCNNCHYNIRFICIIHTWDVPFNVIKFNSYPEFCKINKRRKKLKRWLDKRYKKNDRKD